MDGTKLFAQHGFCLDEDRCACAREMGYRACTPNAHTSPSGEDAANGAQKRDDTGRLTSDYEPTPHEIKVARDAICREFGNNGTDGYYIRILKAIHGAAPARAALAAEKVATAEPVASEAAVPEGWKLVPVEPTDEMIHAVMLPGPGYRFKRLGLETSYRLMVAAAPKPVQPTQAKPGVCDRIVCERAAKCVKDDVATWRKCPHAPQPAQPTQSCGERTAQSDALCYGVGFERRHADGRVEHLPVEQVIAGQPEQTAAVRDVLAERIEAAVRAAAPTAHAQPCGEDAAGTQLYLTAPQPVQPQVALDDNSRGILSDALGMYARKHGMAPSQRQAIELMLDRLTAQPVSRGKS